MAVGFVIFGLTWLGVAAAAVVAMVVLTAARVGAILALASARVGRRARVSPQARPAPKVTSIVPPDQP
ncbi:hypothetical protein [Terrabacter sp. Ter38]|uniref:hypothetical protein n=1 Tax=Terrabacter sp. Ter38 TaxID=2926030 RepID=UPI0021185A1E|nr:hypothetical protein [Terrabacter sp. Ter38]